MWFPFPYSSCWNFPWQKTWDLWQPKGSNRNYLQQLKVYQWEQFGVLLYSQPLLGGTKKLPSSRIITPWLYNKTIKKTVLIYSNHSRSGIWILRPRAGGAQFAPAISVDCLAQMLRFFCPRKHTKTILTCSIFHLCSAGYGYKSFNANIFKEASEAKWLIYSSQ